jgi:HAD superfamily hydrolase (TIGR01509 family)
MIKEISINTSLIKLLKSSSPQTRSGLVTTASRVNARAILEYHDLTRLFEIVVTGDDVVHHKPDPEAYFLAVELLKLSADECLAFEDSEIGIASAKAAGIEVVRIVFP